MDSVKSSLAEQAGSALLWRGFGVAADKLIFLVRLFILARLIAPEDFGLFAIGMTAIAVLVRLTDFGLVPALIQRGAQEKVLLDTAWTVRLVRAAGITIVLALAAPLVAEAFGEAGATNIIRALALATLIDAVASIEIATLTRQLRYRTLTTIQIGAALVNAAISIYLGRSLGAWALVAGTIAGSLAYVIGSYVVAPYRPVLRLSRVSTEQLLRFGRWIFLAGVVAVISETVLRWVISTQLGLAELGLFFVASRLAFLPTQLTGAVFHEVAFPVYTRVQLDQRKLGLAFRTTLLGMVALLLPLSAILLVLVPGIVEHVLGESWQGATQITQLLLIASVAGLLGDASRPLVEGTGHPERVLYMDVARLVVLLGVVWLMAPIWGLLGVGWAYLAAAAVVQVVALVVIKQTVGSPFGRMFSAFSGVISVSIAAAAVAMALAATMPNALGLAVAMLASLLVAAGIGAAVDRRYKLGFLPTLVEAFPRLAPVLCQPADGRRDETP